LTVKQGEGEAVTTPRKKAAPKEAKVSQGGQKLAIRARVVNGLIEAHADEYHKSMACAFDKEGLVYLRPESELERARKQIEELFDRHGSLVLPEKVRYGPQWADPTEDKQVSGQIDLTESALGDLIQPGVDEGLGRG
jgi:hypothetical protein